MNWLDRQLEIAAKTVAAWPEWKRTYLREQINDVRPLKRPLISHPQPPVVRQFECNNRLFC
jgi:hypothetical protein